MDDAILKLLLDAKNTSENILLFSKEKNYQEYNSDLLLKSAIERQFEILGEALKRIRNKDKDVVECINGWREAISFRNILAHGYDSIDDEIVWAVVKNNIPDLLKSINNLLEGIQFP